MTLSPSFYEVLGVSTTCSSDDVRRAYHQLARQHHPDKRSPVVKANRNHSAVKSQQQQQQLFLCVQEAYETLRNTELRRQYDAKLQQDALVRKREHEAVVVSDEVTLSAMQRVYLQGEDDDAVVFTHTCRCGDVYEISEIEIWDGVDVVPCSGCSLHIRVLPDN
uniref:Diphthamide biosynthesis protein 4 n=1 Tax=Peronospora matthiolae TaxID=2874970 RepID=A0AAV1TCN2_9STRA